MEMEGAVKVNYERVLRATDLVCKVSTVGRTRTTGSCNEPLEHGG